MTYKFYDEHRLKTIPITYEYNDIYMLISTNLEYNKLISKSRYIM